VIRARGKAARRRDASPGRQGSPEAVASLIRRTLIVTTAPILNSLADCTASRFGELGVGEADPAQGTDQDIGHRGEPEPQLVGAHGGTRCAVGEQIVAAKIVVIVEVLIALGEAEHALADQR